MVFHFLKTCPAYEQHRVELYAHLPWPKNSIENMLSDAKAIKAVMKYINSTGRFA
jgi:hypothetical protein